MNVHICWSRVDREYRRVTDCPTCKRRRRFYVWAQDYYDAIWTCCTCGDAWSGDERMSRPFARGWRQRSAAWARERWSGVAK